MHIPDNFLSPPVWATLDVVVIPAFGIIARHASRQMEDARIPLLGVMGAFVFAAQMINFPVGLGTSAHLVGGALLAYALGPAFAVITLTAILATQAFVFQDGGVLALGANVFNMAIAGVLVASVFYQLWGRGPSRKAAIFLGAFFSVIVSGLLALSELLVSKVPMSRELVLGSIGLFSMNALAEGAITLAVIQAIERLNPAWVQKPEASNRKIVAALGAFAVLLAGVGFLLASTAPDGLERIGILTGMASKSTFHAPLADYQLPFWSSNWGRRAFAGIAGLGVIFGLCAFAGKVLGGRAGTTQEGSGVHHVILERWAQGNSPLHLRDPRAKILALLAYLIVLATTPPGATYRIVTYAIVALAGVVMARLPLLSLLTRAAVVLPFSLTFAVITWFAGDHLRAIALVEKTYLSAVAVLIVSGTTPLPALLRGFESLGVPRVLVSVIQFLYRYLFVISEQAQHMRLAAACRCGARKTSRQDRFQSAAGALGVLFARSYARADGIHRAMLARGYNGHLPVADTGRFQIADGVFAALTILVLAVLRTLPY